MVWSAIDLVPSWTKKINPKASDNRPMNRRTKRIMTFYAGKTCIAHPSLTPLARIVQSARAPCRTDGRLPPSAWGQAQRGGGCHWLALSDGHSIRYLGPSGHPARGL